MSAPVPAPVAFSLIELLSTLKHMRGVRDDLRQAIRELQERMRLGHNGGHNAALVVLDGELAIVEASVKKLWESFSNATPNRPAGAGP